MTPGLELVNLSFQDPAENLAFDEVLFDLCEEERPDGFLRFWEPQGYFVVLGYANNATTELHIDRCRQRGIPILRRCTGGGTVVQGPGCLNYSLVLPYAHHRALAGITSTNSFIMQRLASALRPCLPASIVRVEGDSDLVIDGLKVAGSAQRRGKKSILFHGVLLLSFRIGILEELLPMPSREPGYRARRNHGDFVRNLGLSPQVVQEAVATEWSAITGKMEIPHERIQRLAQEKYASDEWIFHRRLRSPP